jgi:tRNA-intron lyase
MAAQQPTRSIYMGILRGGGVWIEEPTAVADLGSQGFGHGALSRTKPDFGTGSQSEGKRSTPAEEHLLLLLEEAFFLCFAADCLTVLDADASDGRLSIQALWDRCLALESNFIARYSTFHHCRGRGWLPKSGLKFGCDFLIYPMSMELAHAPYAVVVEPIDGHSMEPLDALCSRATTLSWHALQYGARVTSNANKTLIASQVLIPAARTSEPPDTLLRDVRVHLSTPQRWSAELGRDGRAVAAPIEI